MGGRDTRMYSQRVYFHDIIHHAVVICCFIHYHEHAVVACNNQTRRFPMLGDGPRIMRSHKVLADTPVNP